MTIKQLNATYLAPDDRLLFRFNTTEDQEFRFWLTRRVTLFILAATHHLLVKNLEQTHTPEAAKAIAQFGMESVKTPLENTLGSEAQQYQAANIYPLGADVILVLDVKCSLQKQDLGDILSMDLVLPGGANVNVKLAGPLLQAMCLLLNQLREHAAWGEIPKIEESSISNTDNLQENQKPSVH